MIRVRCPKCKELLSLADELAGQVHRCDHCKQLMQVPGAKPAPALMPPPAPIQPPRYEEPIVVSPIVLDREPPIDVEIVDDEQPGRLPFEDYFRQSQSVQIEKEKLAAKPMPGLAGFATQPLPNRLPPDAMSLGEQLAYLGRRGPIPRWRWVVFGLVVFLVLAVASVAVVLSFVQKERRLVLLTAGVLFALVGIAGGIAAIVAPKTNTANRRFWICERGMVWEGDGQVGFARWEEIHELYDDFKLEMVIEDLGSHFRQRIAKMGVYRILLDRRIVTIFADPSWADVMTFVWLQTSRAYFRVALQRIHEGKSAGFGVITMDRQGVHANNRLHLWAGIRAASFIQGNSNQLIFNLYLHNKNTVSIDANDVSLPDTAQAVCKVMIEDTSIMGTDPLEPEDVNPFAI